MYKAAAKPTASRLESQLDHAPPPTHTQFCVRSPRETLRLRGGATEEAISVPSFVTDKNDFNHVIRIFNTNLHGHRTVLYSLTGIKGVGRRFGDAVIKRAGVDGTKRMGELSAEEVEKLVQVSSCKLITYRVSLITYNL